MAKLRAIVKGARKIASRKAGHLEPFTRVRLQLAKGRDLIIVTQAETIEAYPALREDLTLTGYAAYVLELLDRFVPDEETALPVPVPPADGDPVAAGERIHPLADGAFVRDAPARPAGIPSAAL